MNKCLIVLLFDGDRWTALCFAVDRGWGHMARLLLESGADSTIVTLDGQTVADLVPHSNKVLRGIVDAFVEVSPTQVISKHFM